jgi:hypothetical protein
VRRNSKSGNTITRRGKMPQPPAKLVSQPEGFGLMATSVIHARRAMSREQRRQNWKCNPSALKNPSFLHSFGFTLPRFEVAATSALLLLLSLVLLSQRRLKADSGGVRANG